MVGGNNVGLIISENERYNGKTVEGTKLLYRDGLNYGVVFGRDGDGMYDLRDLQDTSFVCKNPDEVQVIAFGGNLCTEIETAQRLKSCVTKILNKQISKSKISSKKINVTAVGYFSSPLYCDGGIIQRDYVEPLQMFTKRIFNTDGTIEDIKSRASNTVLFSHCVGRECIDVVVRALADELYYKGATNEQVEEILNSMLAINYAGYIPQHGSPILNIPSVDIFQVDDIQNDGRRFMEMDDIHRADKKKIDELKQRCRKASALSLLDEIKLWSGLIMWESGSQKHLNITLDTLKVKHAHSHNPTDLIYDEHHSGVLKRFLSVFESWFEDVVNGKYSDSSKVAILKQKLSSAGMGKRGQGFTFD